MKLPLLYFLAFYERFLQNNYDPQLYIRVVKNNIYITTVVLQHWKISYNFMWWLKSTAAAAALIVLMCGEIQERKWYNDAGWAAGLFIYTQRKRFWGASKRSGSTAESARVSQKLEHIYRAGWPRLFYLDESRDHRMNVSVLPRQTINIKERPLFCQFALSCWPTQTHKWEENLFYRLWNHANRSFKSLPIGPVLTYSARMPASPPFKALIIFPRILFIHFHSQQSVCSSYCLAISP